jgi:hypothetical protein
MRFDDRLIFKPILMKKLAFLLLLSPFTAFAQKGDVFLSSMLWQF